MDGITMKDRTLNIYRAPTKPNRDTVKEENEETGNPIRLIWEILSFEELLTMLVCGEEQRDVKIISVGGRGSGMSMASLRLSHTVAARIARERGNEREDWSRYFKVV
jgi:hypothetical protein